MAEGIMQANIDHFRRLLATERDQAKRKVLMQCLAEKEQEFAALHKKTEYAAYS